MLTFSNFRLLWQWDREGKLSHSSGHLHGGSLSLNGGGSGGGNGGSDHGEPSQVVQSGEGSDHGGVVDDVLGDVLGGVLLDRDLGDVVDLVVDIVADVLDHRGGVDHGHGGGRHAVLDGHRGGLHLDRLHLHWLESSVGDGRGGSVVDSRGSGVVDDGGHMLDHGHGLADGVNKS